MLPPGRAAAFRTFGICRIRPAHRRENAAIGAAPDVAPNSEPALAEGRRGTGSPLQNWRLIACVFFPFVAGCYLSYIFRTITSTISGPLMSEFGLDAADMGLLASIAFLLMAAAQIPIGVL